MAESQVLSVIRMFAAIAWADGVLAEPEAEGLRRLVNGAELTAEERATAGRFIEAYTTLPDTFLTTLTPEARRGVYRAACRMALVDHTVAEPEKRVLTKLRTLLGVPEDIAAEIESDVPGMNT